MLRKMFVFIMYDNDNATLYPISVNCCFVFYRFLNNDFRISIPELTEKIPTEKILKLRPCENFLADFCKCKGPIEKFHMVLN